jgi:hypothetical protein
LANRRPAPYRDRGPTRQIDTPEVGYWLMKAVKHGPLVPARIFWCDHEPGVPDNILDRGGPFLAAEIAGAWVEVDRVWHSRGKAIDEKEYAFRLAEIDWSKKYAPSEPLANPRQAVSLKDAPLPFS